MISIYHRYCLTSKITKKILVIVSILVVMLQLVGCSKDSNNSVNNISSFSPTPLNQDKDIIQRTPILSNVDSSSDAYIDSSGFINSSLQDGFYIKLDGKIITRVMRGDMFNGIPCDGKYPGETLIGDFLGLDGYFDVEKILSYNKKVVYVGQRRVKSREKEFREIIIQDLLTGNKKNIEIGFYSSRSYFILGNRLYFDEFGTDGHYDNKHKYTVKYLNLDTLDQTTVCVYEKKFDSANFVLKEDGEIAFLVSDSEGMSKIFKYSNGVIKEVVNKRWCCLVDYDKRGIFYMAPANTNEELRNLSNSAQIKESEFILKTEIGEEKVLLIGEKLGEFKVFDDFFLHIDLYYQEFVKKYNYDGVLLNKINTKKWPDFGNYPFTGSRIVYQEGKIQNIFYRQDTNELEIQSITID